MKIQKCDASFFKPLCEFFEEVMQNLISNINYPKWTYGVYPCKDSIKNDIDSGWQYIALEGEKIVGAFILNENPMGNYQKGSWSKNLNEGEYLVIHTLATSPKHFGKGIASKMVRFALDYAKQAGYKGIRLDVVPTNTPANTLYEKMGFTCIGEYDLDRGYEHIPTFLLFEYNF